MFAAFIVELAGVVLTMAKGGNLLEESDTGLHIKNDSWQHASKEIKAMEEVYSKKSEANIEYNSQASLKVAKNIKKETVDIYTEMELLKLNIQHFIPSKMRALIYANLLEQRESKAQKSVSIFFTTQEEVDEAIQKLNEKNR